MVCSKCGYSDPNEISLFHFSFCKVCRVFVPLSKEKVATYASEKIDWRTLEPFRQYVSSRAESQKIGMKRSAQNGNFVVRPPLGYSAQEGKLIPNEQALKVHRIFVEFSKGISMNALAKKYGLSVNGVKKILNNRTYLGEIKFAGKVYKGNHKAIIDADLFLAVGRRQSGSSSFANTLEQESHPSSCLL